MVLSEMTDGLLPQLLQPTGLGDDFPSVKLLELARTTPKKGFISFELDQENLAYAPESIPVTTEEQLFPKTPIINITSPAEAFSDKLYDYCLKPSTPVAILRGLCKVLGLDLSEFTTKKLVEQCPRQPCEVRKQVAQAPETNRNLITLKNQWHTDSTKQSSTVATYAKYQVQTYLETKEFQSRKRKLDDNENIIMMNKQIKFGTNVDLSSTEMFQEQLDEIDKLPWWLRLVDKKNPLSQVGYNILGMNTIQLYMKVLGSRTPGHQENLTMPAVNINIGPDDTEWFCTDQQYWGDIQRLCERHGIKYLSGSWWPNLSELQQAGIPVLRCTQKPGDIIFLNSGTVHWVQATGWCNNVAWNVGPYNVDQYKLAIERYQFNIRERFQSLIPMIQLTWHIARNARQYKKILSPDYLRLIKNCMQRVLWKLQRKLTRYESSGCTILHQPPDRLNSPPNYCDMCDTELFCIIFVKAVPDKDEAGFDLALDTFCETCAFRKLPGQKNWIVLKQYALEELGDVYDSLNSDKDFVTE